MMDGNNDDGDCDADGGDDRNDDGDDCNQTHVHDDDGCDDVLYFVQAPTRQT